MEIKVIFISQSEISCDQSNQEAETHLPTNISVLCPTGGKKKCDPPWVSEDDFIRLHSKTLITYGLAIVTDE